MTITASNFDNEIFNLTNEKGPQSITSLPFDYELLIVASQYWRRPYDFSLVVMLPEAGKKIKGKKKREEKVNTYNADTFSHIK